MQLPAYNPSSLETQQQLIECLTHKKADIYNLMVELDKPKTTLINNLKKLENSGIVEKEYSNNGRRGRSFTIFKLRGD